MAADLYTPHLIGRQSSVHRAMDAVGGYWPPRAAAVRVLEELGELAAALDEPGSAVAEHPSAATRSERLAEELADLWIITTAIANQFLISLPVSGGGAPASKPPIELSDLLRTASLIGRAVNYYDGPKTPTTLAGWVPLSTAIPALHAKLEGLAATEGIALFDAVDRKLELTMRRDCGRFIRGYDPSTSATLRHFESVRRETRCPFARVARLWAAPPWDDRRDLRENVRGALPSLTSFAKAAPLEGLDGYVLPLQPAAATPAPGELGTAFATALSELVAGDHYPNLCLDGPVDVPGWQFQFAGLPMFVSVHAPTYPEWHVRHSSGGTFAMLMPSVTFDRYGIGRVHPGSAATKAAVRMAFGSDKYPAGLIDERVEAYLYVLPVGGQAPDAATAWWQHLRRPRGTDATV